MIRITTAKPLLLLLLPAQLMLLVLLLLLLASGDIVTSVKTPIDNSQAEGPFSGRLLAHLDAFQVHSHAMLFGRESGHEDVEVRLLERYSSEQARARLTLLERHYKTSRKLGELASSQAQVEYVLDAGTSQLMRTFKAPTAAARKCELSNSSALASDLFGLELGAAGSASESLAPELANWMGSTTGGGGGGLLSGLRMPAHVVGLARLLLFVELNRQGFRRQNRSTWMRNVEVEQHKLTFRIPLPSGSSSGGGTDQEATLIIYLRKEAIAGEHPMRAWLQLPSRAELIVDFSGLGPLQQSGEPSDSRWDPSSLFAFPLGRGCSRHLSSRGLVGPTQTPAAANTSRAQQTVFSFVAEPRELWFLERPAPLGHLFVAYDAYARALRVDTAGRDAGGESWSSVVLHDFALGRKYHLSSGQKEEADISLSAPSGGDSQEQPPVSVISPQQHQQRRSRCVVAPISAQELAEWETPEEAQVLPWSRLVEMGRARVRGLETRAYELTSERLPRFLFQPLAYWDLAASQDKLAYNFKRKVSATNTGDPNTGYSIVYFVAKTTTTTASADQLMRVDVHQREVLLYRVEVHDFQWHLAEAPDGQPAESLFSLPAETTCSSSISSADVGGQHPLWARPPARLQIELSYMENVAMLRVLPPAIVNLLSSAPARHKALVRALAGHPSNSLFASQMRDLRTRTIPEELGGDGDQALSAPLNSTTRLLVDLELGPLARLEDVALRAVSIGSALATGLKKPSVRSVTLEQCFWEAASEWGPARIVLFSFCSAKCWLDSQASMSREKSNSRRRTASGALPAEEEEDEPAEYQSSVFMVSTVKSRQLPCELLRIERLTTAPAERPEQLIRSWRDVQLNLGGKILNLIFVNEQQEAAGGESVSAAATARYPELLFKVDRVTLTSPGGENNLATSASRADQIDGVALAGEVTLDTIQLRGPQLDGAPEQCHAHCVANLQCRSFSLCYTRQLQLQGAECAISSLDLLSGDLAGQLRLKLAEFYALKDKSGSAAQRRSNSTAWVSARRLAAMPAGGGGEPSGEAGDSVAFRVKRRCQLRAMQAREMFVERQPRAKRTLWQSHLLPVADLDACAETCLRKNVNFFKRLASLHGDSREPADTLVPGDGAKPTELRNQLAYAMRFWCAAFYYLDTRLEPPVHKLMGELRAGWTEKGLVGGRDNSSSTATNLCYMVRPDWAPSDYAAPPPPRQGPGSETTTTTTKMSAKIEDAQAPPQLVALVLERREFRHELLYERQPGFRLALTRGSSSGMEQQQQHQIVNHQSIETHPADVEFCARRCFSQAAHWCRSFDVLTFSGGSTTANGALSCVYNSLSLRDLGSRAGEQMSQRQQPLGKTGDPPRVTYDHYEPREPYTLDNTALSYLNGEIAETGGRDLQMAPRDYASQPDGFGALLFVLAGLCTGLALALVVARSRFLKRRRGSPLDAPRLSREFIYMEEPLGAAA